MGQDGRPVLVAVNDIFFYTKIRDALLPDGFRLERARTEEEMTQKATTLKPVALIMNMNDERYNALAALEQVKGMEASRTIPILAFANHEEVETFRRAKELGVTKIVSRNEFSSRTRDLVRELIGSQQSAGPDQDPVRIIDGSQTR